MKEKRQLTVNYFSAKSRFKSTTAAAGYHRLQQAFSKGPLRPISAQKLFQKWEHKRGR